MYNFDQLNYYLGRLERLITDQQSKINQLEEEMTNLQGKFKDFQEQGKTNIEKIEYHFDQLKIETLEGTLNIGLSPQDLSNVEDLAIPNSQPLSRENPHDPVVEDFSELLEPFFQQDLPSYIDKMSKEFQVHASSDWKNMVIQDIYRQLPERIHFYTKQFKEDGKTMINEDDKKEVIENLQNEIYHSVKTFIQKHKGG